MNKQCVAVYCLHTQFEHFSWKLYLKMREMLKRPDERMTELFVKDASVRSRRSIHLCQFGLSKAWEERKMGLGETRSAKSQNGKTVVARHPSLQNGVFLRQLV